MLSLSAWQESISNHTKHIHRFTCQYWPTGDYAAAVMDQEDLVWATFQTVGADENHDLAEHILLCHAVITSPTGPIHLKLVS